MTGPRGQASADYALILAAVAVVTFAAARALASPLLPFLARVTNVVTVYFTKDSAPDSEAERGLANPRPTAAPEYQRTNRRRVPADKM